METTNVEQTPVAGLLNKTKLYRLFFQESGKVLRQLIEESRTGVYIADEQGNLVYVNSAFVTILGYQRKEELLGKNLARELYANPTDREAFLKAMEKTGFVRDYEVCNLRKDRSVVVLSVTSNWIKDDANGIIGVEGIVRDITDKKKIEEAFKQEREKLSQIMDFEESLSLIHDANQAGKTAVREIADIFQAQKCSLMRYNHEEKYLYIQAAKGLDEQIVKNTRKKMGEGISGIMAQKRCPVLVSNIDYDKDFQQFRQPYYSTRSFISAPVMLGQKFLGIINVTDKISKEAFSDTDLKMLCAAAKAVGITLENAAMYRQLENLAFGQPWVNFVRWY